MNRIKCGDVITLSDKNEYAVTGITNYQDNEYLYLIDINNNRNIKFVLLSDTKVVVLNPKEDWNLISILLPRFLDSVKDLINFDEFE